MRRRRRGRKGEERGNYLFDNHLTRELVFLRTGQRLVHNISSILGIVTGTRWAFNTYLLKKWMNKQMRVCLRYVHYALKISTDKQSKIVG